MERKTMKRADKFELKIGGHVVRIDGDYTETELPDGSIVPAIPEYHKMSYWDRARELGYQEGFEALADMSQDHELGHAFIAALLGLPESPTMRGVVEHREGRGPYYEHWEAEEALVLALQKFVKLQGLDMIHDVITPYLLTKALDMGGGDGQG